MSTGRRNCCGGSGFPPDYVTVLQRAGVENITVNDTEITVVISPAMPASTYAVLISFSEENAVAPMSITGLITDRQTNQFTVQFSAGAFSNDYKLHWLVALQL